MSNKVQEEVRRIVRTMMNEEQERIHVRNKNLFIQRTHAHHKRLLDEDQWIATWGDLDVMCIMWFAVMQGVPPIQMANEWVNTFTDQDRLNVYQAYTARKN